MVKHLFWLTLILLLSFAFSTSSAEAAAYLLRMGPAGLGNGGPNPLGIPPAMTDLELAFVSQSGFEANLGVPGLLLGYRVQKKWGGYVALGGGVAINANGAGPAMYSSFGYDFGWRVIKFNFEYKQAIGISPGALISPYAVRFGMGIWFH